MFLCLVLETTIWHILVRYPQALHLEILTTIVFIRFNWSKWQSSDHARRNILNETLFLEKTNMLRIPWPTKSDTAALTSLSQPLHLLREKAGASLFGRVSMRQLSTSHGALHPKSNMLPESG